MTRPPSPSCWPPLILSSWLCLDRRRREPSAVRGMLTRMEPKTSRRAFLGLAAAGVAGAAAGCTAASGPSGAPHSLPLKTRRPSVPENSKPGDPHWALRHLGGEHDIEGYAGK